AVARAVPPMHTQGATGSGTNQTLRQPMRSHDLCAAVRESLTGQGHLVTAPGICPYAVFPLLQRAYGRLRSQSTGLASVRHCIKLLCKVSPTGILLQMTRRSIILSRVATEVPNMPS